MTASTERAASQADVLWLTQLHDVSLSRMLYAVTRLGVPDLLGRGEDHEAAELADRLGVDADSLNRILRALAAAGILERTAGTRYRNTPTSLLLCTNGGQLADEVQLQAEYLAFGDIEDVVRTGRPAMAEQGGFYQTLDRNEDWANTFRRACQSRSGRTFSAVLRSHDWGRSRRILDIGGGVGHHLETVLVGHPGKTGTLIDRAAGIALAREREWQPGVRDRVEFAALDYMADPMPSADSALLVNVLHNLPDHQVRELLAGLRQRSACDRLVIGEYVLPESADEPHPGLFADVWMLVLVGGRERRRSEFENLLSEAGWKLVVTREDPVTRGALMDCTRAE
ncbi:methyltransferase [Streptomyces sp. NPDC057438]|uniref:methyltransferase n=1 Tax=Streptomyces sp. NPDC057438 TaxID=3346133 RepID=UPI003685A837